MGIQITRRLQFCAGHRVYGHEGHCRHPHGHNYVVFLTATSDSKELDSLGRVIDFSVLKEKFGSWIHTNWDHKFLVYEKDREMLRAFAELSDSDRGLFVCEFNPTAENMAEYLLKAVAPRELAETGVTLTKIVIWETENCFAEASL